MIGAKLIIVALAVATAAVAVSANDLAAGLGALTGGLTGGLGGGGLGGGLGGLGELLGGKKGGENSVVMPTKSQDKTEVKPSTEVSRKENGGFLGTKTPMELFKLLLNPFDLTSKIADEFRLNMDKFFPAVSKGINFGLELAAQPLVLSLKIIEKVFVPDGCKLKLACDLARKVSFLRDVVPKLSSKVLNGSKFFKALSDGIHNDCHTIYECNGKPKIKEEFKNHQKDHHHKGGEKQLHESGHKHAGHH